MVSSLYKNRFNSGFQAPKPYKTNRAIMRQPKTHPLAPLISLNRLSQKSFSIANLLKLANNRQSLDTLLDQHLPELYVGHLKVNSFHDGKLVLTCSSAKLMTKFRFIQDQIIESLNTQLTPKKISSIQIKIRPNINTNTPKQKTETTQRSISKKNAQILLEEAEHTEDQNLRKILTILANHADKD